MKIEWKSLSLAMIISIIATGIFGLILELTNIMVVLTNPSLEKLVAYPIVITGHVPYFLPFSELIVIALTLILVLTLIFYFLIGLLRKHKKQV
jgi:hypothetical protein